MGAAHFQVDGGGVSVVGGGEEANGQLLPAACLLLFSPCRLLVVGNHNKMITGTAKKT